MSEAQTVNFSIDVPKKHRLPAIQIKPHKAVSGIYGILNSINGKIYIGSAVSVLGRWHRHRKNLCDGKHPNRFLQSAFNQTPEAFEFVLIEEIQNLKLLVLKEQFWMGFYRSCDNRFGYNLRKNASSNLGIKLPAGAGQKISKANRGRKYTEPYSDERRRSISEACKGRVPWSKGVKFSPEARLKMSEGRRRFFRNGGKTWIAGKKHSPEAILKMKARRNGVRANIQA